MFVIHVFAGILKDNVVFKFVIHVYAGNGTITWYFQVSNSCLCWFSKNDVLLKFVNMFTLVLER